MTSPERASEVLVEWDESGCNLIVVTDEETYGFVVSHPDRLYANVEREIKPWLDEMQAAWREYHAAKREGRTPFDSDALRERLNREINETGRGECPFCGQLIWSVVRHCYRCPSWPR